MDRQTCKHNEAEECLPETIITPPLLYQAALQGVFGRHTAFSRSSITDALFVYLNGEPEPESLDEVDDRFRVRPLVCLTEAWKELIEARYPNAATCRRFMMKPSRVFILPKDPEIPKGYRLAAMDEAAFEKHPFSHGDNYVSWRAFQADGSGAVVYHDREIVAAASSFLSLNGEVELDVSTEEAHQGRMLASACISLMLRDCMNRGFIVHWDAQNRISLHLARKFGFETETAYTVYWLPEKLQEAD